MLKQLKSDDSRLVLTNLKKVFWTGENYTKGDLLDYYKEIAPVILPHLKDRPQIMHRHLDGQKPDGKDFFQRISRDQPSWLQTVSIQTSKRSYERRFVLCQDWPSLLWMANFGCVELIPWNSRVGTLDYPDYMVIDLDPQEVRFDQVVEVAQAVNKLLHRIGADSFCKPAASGACTSTCRWGPGTSSVRPSSSPRSSPGWFTSGFPT